MNDEHEQPDLDARVRSATRAGDASVQRVVSRAMAAHAESSAIDWRRALVVSTAALVLIGGAARWRWRSATRPAVAAVTLRGDGSMIVAEASDGRRWMIGPGRPDNGRNYVIVVSVGETR